MLRILVVFLLLFAAPAGALPVTVYADGNADYGFDPNDVAAAIAAGAGEPILLSGLFGGQGFFSITTPNGIPGVKGKNKGKPAKGSSTWTLQIDGAVGPELLANFYVVILGHDPNDPLKYKTENVGLEIGTALPWLFVKPGSGGPTYVAFKADQICELEPGGTCQIPIEYRVGQKLKKKKGKFFFPRYSVAFVAVPEPSAWMMLFAAALGLAARRSR